MSLAHIVLLIATTIAVAAIAGYLIAIALILKHVVERLVTVLGAVQATTETAQPVGEIIEDLNRDLDAGRKLLEDGVRRLEESRVPVGATAGRPSRHAEESASDAPGADSLGSGAAAAPPTPAPFEAADEDPESAPRGGGRGWWNR